MSEGPLDLLNAIRDLIAEAESDCTTGADHYDELVVSVKALRKAVKKGAC